MTPEQLSYHVTEFDQVRPKLTGLATCLADEFRQLVCFVAPHALIESRVKNVASFAEKILRKRKYSLPLRDITDLVGLRVVTQLAPETERVVALIRQRFTVDERNSVDKARDLRSGEFGYLSQHLVLVLDRTQLGDADLPAAMLPLRIEVQVRTLLQHAWSAIGHDRLYKSGFGVPERWQRQAARLAANLESADAGFVELASGIDAYRGRFGVYLEPEAVRKELALVTSVRKHAPKDSDLAERQARLALSLGDWSVAIEAVEQFAGERTAGLWCCLGLAQCGQTEAEAPEPDCDAGVAEFRQALALDSDHQEALLLLARQLEDDQPAEAASLFDRVLKQDAHNPGAVAGSLRIAAGSGGGLPGLPLWIALTKPALRRCDTFIEVGMDLVPSLRWRATFLLLDHHQTAEGLAALAEAVQACRHPRELRELLRELTPLQRLADQCPAVKAAWRMVSLALFAQAPDTGNGSRVAGWAGEALPVQGPVWIIAGGCAPEAEAAVAEAGPLLEPAFRDFCGTVISGGTRQGVGGLVGEAAARWPGRFASLGYLPADLSPSPTITPDDRYTELRRKGHGSAFSWNEPLYMWADILRSGIRPGQVTLLGINGGVIAAFEYRLASALGARVGVLPDSGRAAAVLDLPGERKRFPGVLRLPADATTLRLFVERETPGLELPADALERLAQRAHEEYRSSVPARVEPSHEPWERLDDSLKASNRDQIRRSIEVLRAGGFTVQPIMSGARVREFGTEEIEVLAEAEHGRWVLERLDGGWQTGPVKDVAQKRSPHLVPWDRLTDDVKEWDRRAVRGFSRRLAEAGLAITRMKAPGG
jgi:ppGpp synthetase/RelA/SpoT-type nucleotidyltranferase